MSFWKSSQSPAVYNVSFFPGSQDLPAKWLQLGLLLPWGQELDAVWTSTSFSHPPALAWSPSPAGGWAAATDGQLASPRSSHGLPGDFPVPGTLPPLLLH